MKHQFLKSSLNQNLGKHAQNLPQVLSGEDGSRVQTNNTLAFFFFFN